MTVPESFLIKCQAGGLQPYLKRDFDTIFFDKTMYTNTRN